jgi:CubicO group peptidase (beta-lactamase class C family)
VKQPLLLLLVLVLILEVFGTPVQNSAPTFDAAGAAELDAVLQRAVQRNAVPGLVAVVANKDRIIYEGVAGLADVAHKKPMRKDEIFRIASMTKPYTSVAAMMLIEEGKLSLDDPVSKFIPSFKNRELVVSFNASDGSYTTKQPMHEPLIRHLLSHTAGISYTFANAEADSLQKKLNKPSDELPLLYEPGTQWTYSGSTKVLGTIIEKITGAGLDKFFDARIIKPLGLLDTSFAVSASKMDRLPTTHQRSKGRLVESPNPAKIQWAVAGDGGLNSTAQDYVRFLQIFLNDGKAPRSVLLSADSIREMTRNQIGDVVVQKQVTIDPSWSQSFPMGAGRDKFGFGFQIAAGNSENPDMRSAGSLSWAGIFNTHFWVDPNRKIAVVLMMQVLPFYDDECMKVYAEFESAVGRKLRTR